MHNSIKRSHKEGTFHRLSKVGESPLCIYLGTLTHAKTRNKGIIERLFSLGLSISYTQVLELSTVLGNDVLRQYQKHKVKCPPSLRKNVFTAAAIDNIDHNPSSTSAEGSFHGTGISLFQHITEEEPGVVQHKKSIQSSSKKLSQLQSIYANITPISAYNLVPLISDNYSTLQSNQTFGTGEKIGKDQRYILK